LCSACVISRGDVAWWGWLFFEKKTREVLGSVDVIGPLDSAGDVGMVFSVYEL
jgi:hypothetical protein